MEISKAHDDKDLSHRGRIRSFVMYLHQFEIDCNINIDRVIVAMDSSAAKSTNNNVAGSTKAKTASN
jgi:hypothetical protein